jgi:hypothetical protein
MVHIIVPEPSHLPHNVPIWHKWKRELNSTHFKHEENWIKWEIRLLKMVDSIKSYTEACYLEDVLEDINYTRYEMETD